MFRINLLPPEEKQKFHLKEILVVAFAVIIIGAMSLLTVVNYYQKQILTVELADLNAQFQSYQNVVRQINETEAKKNELERRLVLRNLFTTKLSWAEFLKELAYCTPEKLYFSRVSINRDGVLTLEGETTDHHQVAVFMDTLEYSPYFYRVTLSQSTSSWQDEKRYTDFGLTLNVFLEGGY